MQSPPKRPEKAASHFDIGRQISSSNATSNLFLNAPQRSWMTSTLAPPSTSGKSSRAAYGDAQKLVPTKRSSEQVTIRKTPLEGIWPSTKEQTNKPSSPYGEIGREPARHDATSSSARTHASSHTEALAIDQRQGQHTDPAYPVWQPTMASVDAVSNRVGLQAQPYMLSAAQSGVAADARMSENLHQPGTIPRNGNRVVSTDPAAIPGTAAATANLAKPQSSLAHPQAQQVASADRIGSPTQLLTPVGSPVNTTTSIVPQKRSQPSKFVFEHSRRNKSVRPSTRSVPSFLRPDSMVANSSAGSLGREVVSQHADLSVPSLRDSFSNHWSSETGDQAPLTVSAARRNPSMSASPGSGSAHVPVFDTTIQAMRNRLRFSTPVEVRLQWVRDACANNDRYFLLLHQLSCMWTVQRAFLQSHFGMGIGCDNGFHVLTNLFGDNTAFPQELMAYFAGFPNSPYVLQSKPELTGWIQSIRGFLPQFGQKWPNFRQACLTRAYPPLPQEIYIQLQCPISVMLPKAIFCSIEQSINLKGNLQWHNIIYGSSRVSNVPLPRNVVQAFGDEYRKQFSKYHQHVLVTTTKHLAASAQVMLQAPGVHRTARQLHPTAGVVTHPALSSLSRTTQPIAASRRNSGFDAGLELPHSNTNSISGPTNIQSATSATTTTCPTRATSLQGPSSQILPPNQHLPSLGYVSHGTSQVPMATKNTIILRATAGVADRPRTPLAERFNRAASDKTGLGKLMPKLNALPPLWTNPLPRQSALHQAHAWQPVTQLTNRKDGLPFKRFYQYIHSFLIPPQILSTEHIFLSKTFEVPVQLLEQRAATQLPRTDSFNRPARVFTNRCILMHFRSIKLTTGEEGNDEAYWAASVTAYPQHIFASVNGVYLQFRRKRNFKRDLSVDVTTLVHEGENKLVVSYHPTKDELQWRFALAVELIEVVDEETVKDLPKVIPYNDAHKALLAHFQKDESPDDELSMAVDSLTIDLADPFLSTMIKTPVRGQTCKHRECFDLDNYLSSRTSDEKDKLSSVDKWHCPYCKRDARPRSLVIDGFLRHVRNELETNNDLDARAIVIRPDGTWKVKAAVEQNASGRATKSKEQTPAGDTKKMHAATTAAATNGNTLSMDGPSPVHTSDIVANTGADRVIEIIEIDSD